MGALLYAVQWGLVGLANTIIDAKADVDKANDGDGLTPLHQASLRGHVECVGLLLHRKANVKVLDNDGRSPLHYAVSGWGDFGCMQLRLIAAGVEVDRPSNNGYTPLATAIDCKHPKLAELLFHAGAKMNSVHPGVKVPTWMNDIIDERRHVMQSLLALSGVLRRRFKVPCAATAHIGNHIPRDIVNLVTLLAWNTWLDSRWIVSSINEDPSKNTELLGVIIFVFGHGKFLIHHRVVRYLLRKSISSTTTRKECAGSPSPRILAHPPTTTTTTTGATCPHGSRNACPYLHCQLLHTSPPPTPPRWTVAVNHNLSPQAFARRENARECELCHRSRSVVETLTAHHLIPRSMHQEYSARGFTYQELELCAILCLPCHRAVHAAEPNAILAHSYFKVELLLTHPCILKHLSTVPESLTAACCESSLACQHCGKIGHTRKGCPKNGHASKRCLNSSQVENAGSIAEYGRGVGAVVPPLIVLVLIVRAISMAILLVSP